jgi:hypothetical protein
MANLAAYEFWRTEWVGTARIRSLAAGSGTAAGAAEVEDRATAEGAWDGVDDAQRDWCSAHGLVPLALTAVREVVERIIQVHRRMRAVVKSQPHPLVQCPAAPVRYRDKLPLLPRLSQHICFHQKSD